MSNNTNLTEPISNSIDSAPASQNSPVVDWLIRWAKGAMVGIGAIVPGFSGGVLAVVFGIYEPMIRFLGNIRVKFWKNVRYFLPVGIGGVIGVVAFSAVVDYAFSSYPAQFTWLFIGFIAGTFPSLVKVSGKEGRKSWHWLLLAGMVILTFFYMRWMETIQNVTMAPNIWGWLLSGILMGLGLVVPGMSPSNFPDLPGALPAYGERHPPARPWRHPSLSCWAWSSAFSLSPNCSRGYSRRPTP